MDNISIHRLTDTDTQHADQEQNWFLPIWKCKLLDLVFFASPGDMCLGPQVTLQTYSTPETTVSTETVFIVEFSVTCKNGLKVSRRVNAQ